MIPPNIAAMSQDQRVQEFYYWLDQDNIYSRILSGTLSRSQADTQIRGKLTSWQIDPARWGKIFSNIDLTLQIRSTPLPDNQVNVNEPVVETSVNGPGLAVAGLQVPSWLLAGLAAYGLWWALK